MSVWRVQKSGDVFTRARIYNEAEARPTPFDYLYIALRRVDENEEDVADGRNKHYIIFLLVYIILMILYDSPARKMECAGLTHSIDEKLWTAALVYARAVRMESVVSRARNRA